MGDSEIKRLGDWNIKIRQEPISQSHITHHASRFTHYASVTHPSDADETIFMYL